MHYRIVDGEKQIHWACKECLIRACCTRFCYNAQLPFGFDDFPEDFMERFAKKASIEIQSYFTSNHGLLYRTQFAKSPQEFRQLSKSR